MTLRVARLTLWCVALSTALAGLVFLVAPVTLPERIDPALAPTEPGPTDRAPEPGAAAEEIAMANLFSTRRAPPSTRYKPADDSAVASGATVTDAGAMATDLVGDASSAAPALYGTVVGVGGAPSHALLLLDASSSAPRLYQEGEGEGGFRVERIMPRAVVLRGANGRITLRLDQEEKRP